MKTFVILCVLVAAASARPEEKYSDKYDNTNLDEILHNDVLLENYHKCIMETGRCTPEGKELRSHIKESLENDCAKCTDKQRKESRHVIGFIINEKPGYWKELTAKYDSTGKYTAKYESELRAAKKN